MGSNAAAVDDGSRLVDLHTERFEYAREVTVLRPVVEAIVNALPGPESLRQITPRNAGLSSIKNRIDELAIADLRLRSVSLFR